ncbi:hypothetical protein B0H17DRAFT_1126495 [Mycena rosella]|uniref:Uncharacterized protein n=1 Tax=Mycena rosella TaxID=1033263 RepID=A0AAD7M7P5_MYCRO|nr:hypothetical protein B0H17DRAFT_1126495 [Mycena rosella]
MHRQPQPSITLECQTGLDALNAADNELDGDVSAHSLMQPELEPHRDGMDICLPFFRDLLADAPIPGASAIRSLGDRSSDSGTEGQNGGKAVAKKVWDGDAEELAFSGRRIIKKTLDRFSGNGGRILRYEGHGTR